MDLAGHQTAFVASVVDALGLDRAAVIGASQGGWYALRFTIERPERVSAAVLVTAPAMALPGALMPVPMALPSTWLGRRMASIGPPPSIRMTRRMLATIGGDGSVAGAPDALFDALAAAMALTAPSYATLDICRWRTPHPQLQTTEAELAACRPPLLLLWGDADKVPSPEAGERAATLPPQGRLEVLPGGHGLWFEHPQRCGELLTEFLHGTEHQPAETEPPIASPHRDEAIRPPRRRTVWRLCSTRAEHHVGHLGRRRRCIAGSHEPLAVASGFGGVCTTMTATIRPHKARQSRREA